MLEALRICCVDPGTDTLGIGYLDIDLDTYAIRVYDVKTIKASIRQRHLDPHREIQGNRYVNVLTLQDYVLRSMLTLRPHIFIAEAPYSGRFATAFEALVECHIRLRDAVMEYDPSMTYFTIDPKSVKKFVGAMVHKATKDNMKESVIKLHDIDWGEFDPNLLDEHSIDAIAVGYYKAKHIIQFLQTYGGA